MSTFLKFPICENQFDVPCWLPPEASSVDRVSLSNMRSVRYPPTIELTRYGNRPATFKPSIIPTNKKINIQRWFRLSLKNGSSAPTLASDCHTLHSNTNTASKCSPSHLSIHHIDSFNFVNNAHWLSVCRIFGVATVGPIKIRPKRQHHCNRNWKTQGAAHQVQFSHHGP